MHKHLHNKHYLSANQLLQCSYELAAQIIDDGYYPNFIVAIWRGGTPVGIAVQEYMQYIGIKSDHIAIRTSYYAGIDATMARVRVHNLSYLIDNINTDDRLLVVDDVFDSGNSMQAVLQQIQAKARRNTPKQIRVATPYFKPNRNQTQLTPHYFVHQTDDWLVFPHELCGLSMAEIEQHKPGLAKLIQTSMQHKNSID